MTLCGHVLSIPLHHHNFKVYTEVSSVLINNEPAKISAICEDRKAFKLAEVMQKISSIGLIKQLNHFINNCAVMHK